MSKYTTEVRFICETSAGIKESVGYSRIDDIINKAIPTVFNFDFPIFDEAYRNVLCKKILKHYYTREICEETVGLWKFRLDTRMNEIMPYYNQLYKSELLEFNPLYDVDITRRGNKDNIGKDNDTIESTRVGTGNSETDTTGKTTNTNTSNETNESTSNGTNEGTNNTTNESSTTAESTDTKTERDLYSDTPQGALTNVENETYLTNARKKLGEGTTSDTGSSTGTTNVTVTGKDSNATTGEVNVSESGETNQEGNSATNYNNNDTFNSHQVKNTESTEEYLDMVSGKQGGASYSKMLMEYRDTFLNIDMQVIDALSDLFFGLW